MYPQYGNVVVIKGTDFKSKFLLGLFTGSYQHCGILTSENVMDTMTRRGKRSINLVHDLEEEDFGDFFILEHIGMTPELRRKIREYNEGIKAEYDTGNIRRLAKRHLLRKKPDEENISTEGMLMCSSYTGELYLTPANLPIFDYHVHPSQIEPPHFLQSRYFKVVGKGGRNKPIQPLR
ncbi:hypothetical protein HYT25_01005 [Candidatus Pacearchaeota archaeon]|nr:hypothetical protein [Candidatus Pacearchaeota archaeon]